MYINYSIVETRIQQHGKPLPSVSTLLVYCTKSMMTICQQHDTHNNIIINISNNGSASPVRLLYPSSWHTYTIISHAGDTRPLSRLFVHNMFTHYVLCSTVCIEGPYQWYEGKGMHCYCSAYNIYLHGLRVERASTCKQMMQTLKADRVLTKSCWSQHVGRHPSYTCLVVSRRYVTLWIGLNWIDYEVLLV